MVDYKLKGCKDWEKRENYDNRAKVQRKIQPLTEYNSKKGE